MAKYRIVKETWAGHVFYYWEERFLPFMWIRGDCACSKEGAEQLYQEHLKRPRIVTTREIV